MSKILVVDDDIDCRDAVAGYLAKAGHTVQCAKDGPDALKWLGKIVPDLLVLDYRMPGMDGISVLRVLRSYLRWGNVPVVLLTAYPDEPRIRESANLRVERVFVKSVYRLEDLLAFINQRLGIRRADPSSTPASRLGLTGLN
jgi:CheY-like chemotaxis protein